MGNAKDNKRFALKLLLNWMICSVLTWSSEAEGNLPISRPDAKSGTRENGINASNNVDYIQLPNESLDDVENQKILEQYVKQLPDSKLVPNNKANLASKIVYAIVPSLTKRATGTPYKFPIMVVPVPQTSTNCKDHSTKHQEHKEFRRKLLGNIMDNLSQKDQLNNTKNTKFHNENKTVDNPTADLDWSKGTEVSNLGNTEKLIMIDSEEITMPEREASNELENFEEEIMLPDSINSEKRFDSDHNLMHFGKKFDHDVMHFGKRFDGMGHDVMHFGKRFDGMGHDVMHFGKRFDGMGHDVMHFGKRFDGMGHDVMHFGKRFDGMGHDVMHFGKRLDGMGHDVMHFGKRFDGMGHDVMHFGKRFDGMGHDVMHFGKRFDGMGHDVMHFGKRDTKNETKLDSNKNVMDNNIDTFNKRLDDISFNHDVMHFGKRSVNEEDEPDNANFDKRFSGFSPDHDVMHFGKRFDPDHNVMHFGKRFDPDHNVMHFGKRFDPDHNVMHFGKRFDSDHNVMHFGKRFDPDHNVMHFGKRFDPDHNVMHFGKRFDPDHNVMHFGKRFDPDHNVMHFGKRFDPDHNVMHFGKKFDPDHNVMHFGKRFDPDHNVMHFGKRYDPDHNVMHFGKRFDPDHNVMHFGKRFNPDHNVMHFGKRFDPDHNVMHFGKKFDPDHNVMHFGKRFDPDHNVMHFGKKFDPDHNVMHFGKRFDPDHNVMHFGKRFDPDHNVMHFGKRFDPDHNVMHFGKRFDPDHNVMHFGKRFDPDHNVMHFGKRSADSTRNLDTLNLIKRSPLSEEQHALIHFGKRTTDGEGSLMKYIRNFIRENNSSNSFNDNQIVPYFDSNTGDSSNENSKEYVNYEIPLNSNFNMEELDTIRNTNGGTSEESPNPSWREDPRDEGIFNPDETRALSSEGEDDWKSSYTDEDNATPSQKFSDVLRGSPALKRSQWNASFKGPQSLILPNAWLASQIRRSFVPVRYRQDLPYFGAKMEEKKEIPANLFMHFG